MCKWALCQVNIMHMEAFMTKKKKIEVKTVEDIKKLEKKEQAKWEVAVELGLFDKVTDTGWKSLTSRESGKIGGILASRQKKAKKLTS